MGTTANRINRVGKMLIGQQLTIAFAESATAGRLTELKAREKLLS